MCIVPECPIIYISLPDLTSTKDASSVYNLHVVFAIFDMSVLGVKIKQNMLRQNLSPQ